VVILALDASTYAGTVALLRDDAVVGERSAAMRGEREERLMPAVEALLAASGTGRGDLSAIACGGGPGSFTSLRIAASLAKGLAVGLDIPLLVAPSPLLIVAGAVPPLPAGHYLAVADAMRGDLFGMDVVLDAGGRPAVRGGPWLARRSDVERYASASGAMLVGPDADPERPPHARGMGVLRAAGLAVPVDRAAWEPEYGRKAEAQVRWERVHGRPLGTQ
jgi:tRNA threonylcarbamoyladenosine biosynthesis protein TsaB